VEEPLELVKIRGRGPFDEETVRVPLSRAVARRAAFDRGAEEIAVAILDEGGAG
jgi:hypothetical protein